MYQSTTPHNLGLYRLYGFSGMHRELLGLHEWLTGGDDLPAIAISGEQGVGKSTLATAAAWTHLHHFTDGVIRVSAAGTNPFRLYDVVRTLDSVLGTTLTRVSRERWGISILEQLYRRKRLLIIDKLAGGTEQELNTLVDIIGHLHEAAGNSRIVLIDRNFSPAIAELVQHQHLHLAGLSRTDTAELIAKRAPESAARAVDGQFDELYALTQGRPLLARLILGLLLDYGWTELSSLLQNAKQPDGSVRTADVAAFAVESYATVQPQVGPLLDRLVSASGGASLSALQDLFWGNLGAMDELDRVLEGLTARALLEMDHYHQRVVMHPVIRRYLEQNAAMLGEDWDRTHARYYLGCVRLYQQLPQERWPEIDVEWGNIYQAADWCAARVERLWNQEPLALLDGLESQSPRLPIPAAALESIDDLRLARDYAIVLAYYAFWRHPLGILRWLASGALAALALMDHGDYAWLETNIGRQLFFIGRVAEATRWLERAWLVFEQQDRMGELASVLTDLGTSLRILDQPRQALDFFHAAFDCVVQTGDQQALTTAYMNLGSAYYSLGNYERAFREHQKALRIALRWQDEQSVASAFNNMGLAMEGMENFDEAQKAYEHALNTFRRLDDRTGVSMCYNNLGSACYARGDFNRALMWYELDLGLSARRGSWTDMAATLHNLGHVALEQEAFDRALAYFEQSRDLYAAFELTDYVQEEEEMITYIRSYTKL